MKYTLFFLILLFTFTNCKTSQNKPAEAKTDKKTEAKDCIDASKINPNLNCVMIYKPVCGCNGKTYGNSCEAQREGVTSWTEGACK